MSTNEQIMKRQKLRNTEYYGLQKKFDELYADSLKGRNFNKLLSLIESDENIKLAYRNLKSNKGSNTPGTDKMTIDDISKWSEDKLIHTVRSRLANYVPQPVRRKEIPKPNGKMRPLGIPTITDRIVQQCIKQMLEPICEAKFHDRNNGFRPNRSAENALAQSYKLMQQMNLHYVVDIDIKGFFDNVNHGKLMKQLWTLGIRDKSLLCIIRKMLKGEIAGIGFPEKGTPQGGILSPLLSNVVLNELDWWVSSQWEDFPTEFDYKNCDKGNGGSSKSGKYRPLRDKSNLKECYIVRYADDFKIFCRNYDDARRIFIATRIWLKERLGLEISEEKSKIVNLRKNYSEFLGFRLKVRKKGKKRVVTSHIGDKALDRIKSDTKELVNEMQHPRDRTEAYRKISKFNSYVMGVQNYYRIATNVQEDLDKIAFNVRKNLEIRVRTRMSKKSSRGLPRYIAVRYGDSKQLRYVDGHPLVPLGYVQHKSPMYKASVINSYTVEGRKAIHKNLQCIDLEKLDYLMRNPIANESVELNDNRISLYVAQQGKCCISGKILELEDINVYHKKDLHWDKQDAYQNLALVCNKIFILLTISEEEEKQALLTELKLDSNAIEKLKKFRQLRK